MRKREKTQLARDDCICVGDVNAVEPLRIADGHQTISVELCRRRDAQSQVARGLPLASTFKWN